MWTGQTASLDKSIISSLKESTPILKYNSSSKYNIDQDGKILGGPIASYESMGDGREDMNNSILVRYGMMSLEHTDVGPLLNDSEKQFSGISVTFKDEDKQFLKELREESKYQQSDFFHHIILYLNKDGEKTILEQLVNRD